MRRTVRRTVLILGAVVASVIPASPGLATQTGITVVTDGTIPFTISGSVLPGIFQPPNSLTIPYECHAAAVGSSNVAIPTANEDDPDEHGCSLWQDQSTNPEVHNWIEIAFIEPGTSLPGAANVTGRAEDVAIGGQGFRVCWYGFANALVGGDPTEGRGCSDGSGGTTLGTSDLSVSIEGPDEVFVHQSAEYTAMIRSPGEVGTVEFTDTLPGPRTSLEVLPSQGECDLVPSAEGVGTTIVRCHLGSMSAGDVATIIIDVRPFWLGPYPQTAWVTAAGLDPDGTNNHAEFVTFVKPLSPEGEDPPPDE